MAAPVRNGVELDAVGELHLVLGVEPAALLDTLGGCACCFRLGLALRRDLGVVGELVLFVFVLLSSRSCTPSSVRDTSRGRGQGRGREALVAAC